MYSKRKGKRIMKRVEGRWYNVAGKWIWRGVGAASGAALGFIDNNMPGAMAGAQWGYNAAKRTWGRPLNFYRAKLGSNRYVKSNHLYGSNQRKLIGSNPGIPTGSNPGRPIGSNPRNGRPMQFPRFKSSRMSKFAFNGYRAKVYKKRL